MKMIAVGALGLVILGRVGAAGADVVVRLDSGNEVRGVRAWRDGDVVRVAFRTGVASFPAASVVAIEEATSLPPPARDATASDAAPAARSAVPQRAPSSPVTKGAAAPAQKSGATAIDETIPKVAGEDSQTKLERLDALSMQTHRQLSVARTKGESQETLDALQRKIDAINDQRMQTMKKLGR